jgi:hypothetical protein
MSNCVVGSVGLRLPCSIIAEQQLLTSMRGIGRVLAFTLQWPEFDPTRPLHCATRTFTLEFVTREAVGHAQSENDCNPPGGGNQHCRP